MVETILPAVAWVKTGVSGTRTSTVPTVARFTFCNTVCTATSFAANWSTEPNTTVNPDDNTALSD